MNGAQEGSQEAKPRLGLEKLGAMDMALALRTMVIPTRQAKESAGSREWMIHLQAGAGVVADSNPESEYQETVNKAAALGRAIDLAESAFTD